MRPNLYQLTDDELIASLKTLVKEERERVTDILRHLAEMDRRRLADKHGYPSLFEYCVKALRFAEGETARRIHASRAAVKYPVLYRYINRGLMNVTAVSLLAPHLNHRNHRQIIRSAVGRNTRQIEALVATLAPTPDRPDRVKFLGTPVAVEAARAAETPPTPAAASDAMSALPQEPPREPSPFFQQPQRVHFSFTADERLLAAVERAKELLQNKYGKPEFEHVFFEAVGALLEKIDPDVRAVKARAPRVAPVDGERRRATPSWVKRAVWRRDRGRCVFRGDGARLCGSRAGLQYDHVLPWALGGRSDDPANIRLLCRRHNALEARRALGEAVVDAALERARAG